MYCLYCDKLCKNKNSLTQHEIRCKLNPNKIVVNSNFIEYNKKVSDGLIDKVITNQYTKASVLGLPKPIMSDETKSKIGMSGKNRVWTQEMRDNHSKSMIQASINYPESYSSNNVCGRTKLIDVIDSIGNLTKVNGGWEKIVVDYLNTNNINWTNKITEQFYYFWNGKTRIYYPDFYLVDYDKYIEVKGYQRERDLHKWEILKDRLIIIKKDDISLIKLNMFKLNL